MVYPSSLHSMLWHRSHWPPKTFSTKIQSLYRLALRLNIFFDEGTKPYKSFLTKHINQREKEFFSENIAKLWPPKYVHSVSSDSLFILLPAFTISELTRAFEIGFLLYLPFIAIDLIVSNILLAMGMMMVSPMTISLPFKLLLFVMFDGWSRLSHGLILSYSG